MSSRLLKLGVAFCIAGLAAVHLFATETGEEVKGELPAGQAVHLKRLKDGNTSEFFQNSLNLVPGGDYVLTFWARASGSFKLNASTKVSAPPWAFFGLRDDVQLTPQWRRYTLKFKADGAIPEHSRVAFGFAAPAPADVWLADIQVRRAGAADSSEGHIVANARFEDDLEQWYVEGKRDGIYEAVIEPVSQPAPK